MSVQLHQSLNLLLLLIIGSFTANVHLAWMDIVFILLFTLFVEHLFLYFNASRPFYFSYSSLTTVVGVMVLVYANSLWIYCFIIALGLAQKHFLTLNAKHFFNPSNFALIMALFFFYEDAHLITGQFGDEPLFSMTVFVLALSILVRVGRALIPFLFLFFYLALQYFLVLYFDPSMTFQQIYHRFYSASFMLFIYFMLTDPLVTPGQWQEQIIFIFFMVLIATLLDSFYGFRVQHLFMSLFFVSFFVHYQRYKNLSPRGLKLVVTILFSVIVSLVYIEHQAPYYFEMNG
ncbi:MAG: Unknown protein [uncultured Sulfurovum sp.]|uniref:Uncharacterized protein n=1 Tax=uncultured Sulfurovum sp. TaxID=269237 RepID=A0A6S6TBM7_9BACT|nr:MAG: Unknown protein [uncultured Sulfurovum sp.]